MSQPASSANSELLLRPALEIGQWTKIVKELPPIRSDPHPFMVGDLVCITEVLSDSTKPRKSISGTRYKICKVSVITSTTWTVAPTTSPKQFIPHAHLMPTRTAVTRSLTYLSGVQCTLQESHSWRMRIGTQSLNAGDPVKISGEPTTRSGMPITNRAHIHLAHYKVSTMSEPVKQRVLVERKYQAGSEYFENIPLNGPNFDVSRLRQVKWNTIGIAITVDEDGRTDNVQYVFQPNTEE